MHENTVDKSYTSALNPDEELKAVFNVGAKDVSGWKYFNLHGDWKPEG